MDIGTYVGSRVYIQGPLPMHCNRLQSAVNLRVSYTYVIKNTQVFTYLELEALVTCECVGLGEAWGAGVDVRLGILKDVVEGHVHAGLLHTVTHTQLLNRNTAEQLPLPL